MFLRVPVVTVTTWMHFFHNYAHCAMYALGMLLSLSASYEDIRGSHAQHGGLQQYVRRQRYAVEPALWTALGIMLISHVHDTGYVLKLSHAFLGWMFVLLAALQIVSGVIHDVSPNGSIPFALRSFNSFAWLLPGIWLLHMCGICFGRGNEAPQLHPSVVSAVWIRCFFFYLYRSPNGGLHDWLMAAAPQMGTVSQVVQPSAQMVHAVSLTIGPNRHFRWLANVNINGKVQGREFAPAKVNVAVAQTNDFEAMCFYLASCLIVSSILLGCLIARVPSSLEETVMHPCVEDKDTQPLCVSTPSTSCGRGNEEKGQCRSCSTQD